MITVPTIAFAVSLVGILCMLGIKSYEVKTGRNSILALVSEKTNHIVHGWFYAIDAWIRSVNRDSVFSITILGARFIRNILLSIYEATLKYAQAHPQSKKILDMVAGKTPIKRGGASIYLKKIGEDRLMK